VLRRPHVETYAGVLDLLDDVDVDDLRELDEDSWRALAPRRAVREWLDSLEGTRADTAAICCAASEVVARDS
jgi:hypothetical protein